MSVWTRFVRLMVPETALPTEVFVFCESGAPVVACLNEESARREATKRPKKASTSVHKIPLVSIEGAS